jgi:hypothetical protein
LSGSKENLSLLGNFLALENTGLERNYKITSEKPKIFNAGSQSEKIKSLAGGIYFNICLLFVHCFVIPAIYFAIMPIGPYS